MIRGEDIKKFWDYNVEEFGKDEISWVVEDFGFDLSRIEDEALESASEEELKVLYADIVYMILNELNSGDFNSMYDVLSDIMELSKEDIDYLLDW